jgi:two-component system NtrC family response regulator
VTLAPQALDWLSAQPWPGNIRQLKQTLERTLLLAGKAAAGPGRFSWPPARSTDGVPGRGWASTA